MTLDTVIAIAGKPGLFKIISHAKNRVIVESLTDKKRFPVGATHTINALDEIAIYTYNDDVPLREIFVTIYQKEKGPTSVKPTDSSTALVSYFKEILPHFDTERVYTSNIKKVLKWYNELVEVNFDFVKLEQEIQNTKQEDSKE